MNNNLISREALWRKAIRLTEPVKILEVLRLIDNAPTVEGFTKEDMSGAYNEGYACGSRENKRTQCERAERALAIIDRLRTDGHINNKEQGTLRRAVLLPERPQGGINNG